MKIPLQCSLSSKFFDHLLLLLSYLLQHQVYHHNHCRPQHDCISVMHVQTSRAVARSCCRLLHLIGRRATAVSVSGTQWLWCTNTTLDFTAGRNHCHLQNDHHSPAHVHTASPPSSSPPSTSSSCHQQQINTV